MSYKVNYKVENLMDTAPLGSCFLEGEIGARFDRFISERVSGKFAVEEILREAEDFFATQYEKNIIIHIFHLHIVCQTLQGNGHRNGRIMLQIHTRLVHTVL